MSLTKRTYTDILENTLVATGSVTGATTKLTMVFQVSNTLWGVQGTINVYVNGTKQTCTWTLIRSFLSTKSKRHRQLRQRPEE